MPTQKNAVLEQGFLNKKPLLARNGALVEANRCLFCFNAPCTQACPTDIDVPRFIKKIASDNLKGAAKTILDANILGASCARICPTEELCEGACVLHDLHEAPIQIGRLQRYATEKVVIENTTESFFKKSKPNGKKIALIGAGPASLSCAAELSKLGYECTCFDKDENIGGLNSYGIADYKLDYKTAQKEIEWISNLGIKFQLKTTIGIDIPVENLLKNYDAIFMGVGLGAIPKIGIPGEEGSGVFDSLEFIRALKTQPKKEVSLIGKNVAVIGGGNTAIDAAVQAKRLGAENVYLIYRRTREKMRAYPHEQELALKDGVQFILNAQPVEILLEKSIVKRIQCAKTKVMKGQLSNTEAYFSLDVDVVLRATGQAKYMSFLESIDALEISKWKTPIVNENQKTSHPKIWAGGDCVSGGQEVVNAVADGKKAAFDIHKTFFGAS